MGRGHRRVGGFALWLCGFIFVEARSVGDDGAVAAARRGIGPALDARPPRHARRLEAATALTLSSFPSAIKWDFPPGRGGPARHKRVHARLRRAIARRGGVILSLRDCPPPGGLRLPTSPFQGEENSMLAAMRAIKQALDPLDILNPGKIVSL
jgi:FAD linked oxidases, C-terminal domain